MLNPRRIPDKTYESLIEETYSKIPIYSGDWTNFNPSDPGITILEQFCAYQIIQQNQMDQITDATSAGLLSLAGYTSKKGKSARVLIEPMGLTEDLVIPPDQRFYVGNISFETTLEQTMTSSHITGVYASYDDKLTDLGFLRNADKARLAYPFGKDPTVGDCLYLVLDSPLEPGENGIIYVNVREDDRRTPFTKDGDYDFARLTFEALCENGFVEMEASDGTHGFLTDGEISFIQPEEAPAFYRDEDGGFEGYLIRIVLSESDYDIAPQIRHLSGFLFPARQKETMVITHSFQKSSDVMLDCVMAEEGYLRVFAKEEKGTSYHLYAEMTDPSSDEKGRFYGKERLSPGRYRFSFDKERFGYAPERVRNAIKIVVFSEKMMRQYYLGEIYGYDRQEIKLPVGHIVTDTFSLIAERTCADGSPIYDFLKPGRGADGQFSYYLYENEGKICILDAGEYIGAKLYLGSLAISLGPEGNVRPDNEFLPNGKRINGITFTNPAPGEGGCFQETIEDVRRRFVNDIYNPQSAVLSSDYEKMIRDIPGLSIQRVHAWMDHTKNEVMVTILPTSEEQFPQISEQYRKRIEDYLNERRMLSTRVTVCQPVYAQVLVRGKIYVKPHFENCEAQITDVIRREISSVTGHGGFGRTLKFDRLFAAIEALECVSYVYDLKIVSKNPQFASLEGSDIRPAEHCLLYPGPVNLEILPQDISGM